MPPRELHLRGSGGVAPRSDDPDTWVWNEELQRFYYTLALEDPKLQDPGPGISPSAKSLQFAWDDLTGQTEGWSFPGQGEAYRTCGTFRWIGCLEHSPGYAKRTKMSCARASCPVCWKPPKPKPKKPGKTWIVVATKAIVRRIEAGEPWGWRMRKPIHVSADPPPKEWDRFLTKKGYLKMRRKAQRIAKRAGFIGGCCIFHPYRENKVKKLWRWSPHFHLLGYGWIESVFKETGWVVKNHLVRKSVGGTAYYQLSHAGVKAGHHVVTWFGTLSWKALRLPRSKPEPETCPTCGAHLIPLIWIGTGDNPLLDPEAEDEASLVVAEWTYWHR